MMEYEATLSDRPIQITVETLIVESHKYVSLVGHGSE